MGEFTFERATKAQRRARIFLSGPSGSGKTWTALLWAKEFGERVAFIDTERNSSALYSDVFAFDKLALNPPFTIGRYLSAIDAATSADYDVLIVDSLSHAWAGRGGLLEEHDRLTVAKHRGDSFRAWGDITPQHQDLIDALVGAPLHVIATARAKQDYQLQQNDRGKWEPVKLGLAPVQREGLDYEFDLSCELTVPDHVLTVQKSRCTLVPPGTAVIKPDGSVARKIAEWLREGRPVADERHRTVAEILAAAYDAETIEGLREVFEEANRAHLLAAAVTDPNGADVALGDEIKAQAARLREATSTSGGGVNAVSVPPRTAMTDDTSTSGAVPAPPPADAPGPVPPPPEPAPEPSPVERAQGIADRAKAVQPGDRGHKSALTALAVEAAKYKVANIVVETGGDEDVPLHKFLDQQLRAAVPA